MRADLSILGHSRARAAALGIISACVLILYFTPPPPPSSLVYMADAPAVKSELQGFDPSHLPYTR